jgi:hypothetical protein
MRALLILLACCRCACALNPPLDVSQCAHTAWKLADGFFKGEILFIAQTPDGYPWLGTEFGLVRFDGVPAVPWSPPGDSGRRTRRHYGAPAMREHAKRVGGKLAV